jgi:methylenetetrahydrofolate dehydrogenase (NADP+) / methenyltetrahydrofolate cyclohydrolase
LRNIDKKYYPSTIIQTDMTILDGKTLSQTIKAEIKAAVDTIRANGGKIPHLAAVLIGNNPASEAYVGSKVRSCAQVGFHSTLVRRDADITQAELLEIVQQLNQDADIDGFIVQLPLPKHIDEQAVNLAIDPRKDVDGFHPMNFGRMTQGMPAFLPATPMGVLEMLRRYEIPTKGKNVVVIGRSNIVGTPLSILLSRKGWDATVTLAHSHTKDIAQVCQQADILIAAVGIAHFVKADMVKAGAVVIDVGINRIEDTDSPKGYQLVGDVDFEQVAPKTSFITPVPGGVGLMTVVALMLNTLQAAKNK